MRNTLEDRRSTRSRASQALASLVAAVCILLQLIYVPLHLATEEHVHPGEPVEQAHHHAEHIHGVQAHRRSQEALLLEPGDEDHDPHAASDHLIWLVTPPSLDDPVAAPLALLCAAPPELVFDAAAHPALPEVKADPWPPPERRAATPRAPPVVT